MTLTAGTLKKFGLTQQEAKKLAKRNDLGTNPFQVRRLDGENSRVIKLLPHVSPPKSNLKKVTGFFKAIEDATNVRKLNPGIDLVGSPVVLSPAGAGFVGSGKLATKLGGSLFGTPKKAGITLLTAGALSTSGVLKEGVLNAPKRTFDLGKGIGKVVDELGSGGAKTVDPSGLLPKLAGLGLGGGLLAGAIGLGVKKFKDKKPSVPALPSIPKSLGKPITPQGGGSVPIPTTFAPTSPSGQAIAPQVKEELSSIKPPKPVTVNNNITIKNSMRKTHKYINTVNV